MYLSSDTACGRALIKTKAFFQWIGYKIGRFFTSRPDLWIIVAVTVLGLLARYFLVPYVSLDLLNYVFPWMKELSPESYGFGGGGFTNIISTPHDQEPLYIMMLGLLAQLPPGPTETGIAGGNPYPLYYDYYVKSMSFIADIFIAIGTYKIVMLKSHNKNYSAIAYAVMFLLPMHLVNSGMWGQCDGIVGAFAVWSFYFILKDRQGLSMLMYGFALAVKPQAIFFAPFVAYLWLERRLKFRWLWFCPLVILITYAPYWLMGSSLIKPFEWLYNGFGSYPGLNYGCGNIWAFFSYYTNKDTANATNSIMSAMAWMFCLAVLVGFIFIAHSQHFKLDLSSLALISTVMIGLTTYFMPKMHERYFYLFEAFLVFYCFVGKRRWWLLVLSQLSACIAYSNFMFSSYFIDVLSDNDNIILIALLNTLVLTVLLYDMFKLPKRSKEEVEAEKEMLRKRMKYAQNLAFGKKNIPDSVEKTQKEVLSTSPSDKNNDNQ